MGVLKIKITEKCPSDKIPYTMVLKRIKTDWEDKPYKRNDIKIKISDLDGDFRLTPSQQKRLISFLKGE